MEYLVIESKCNSGITGGQAINNRLYDDISQKGNRVTRSTSLTNYSGNWGFLISNISHLHDYSKYDHIIIDSSSFSKTIWFVLLFRFFYGNNKLTATLHHFIHENMSGLKGILYKQLEILFIKQFNRIIVFSPYVVDRCKEYVNYNKILFIGLPFKNVITISSPKQYGKLLYVGTIEPRKGLIYLIEALHTLPQDRLKDIELNIIGKSTDERYNQKLKNKIKKYHLESNVIFRGRVTNEELASFYATSQIFTFPSLLEGFGMVLIEAMGYGLPVIAFNNSAMPYTVKTRKNGIIVENKSVSDYGNAILELLNNPTLYMQLSAGAIATHRNAKSFEDFDRDVFTLVCNN